MIPQTTYVLPTPVSVPVTNTPRNVNSRYVIIRCRRPRRSKTISAVIVANRAGQAVADAIVRHRLLVRIIHVGWDKLAQVVGGPAQAAPCTNCTPRMRDDSRASEGPPRLRLAGPTLRSVNNPRYGMSQAQPDLRTIRNHGSSSCQRDGRIP